MPLRFSTLSEAQDFTAKAWEVGLRGRNPERDVEYWKLGINLSRALDIVRHVWHTTALDLSTNLFVESPTINRMAARLYDGSALHPQELVRMREGDDSRPLYLFAGGTGLLLQYSDFVRSLDYPGVIYGVPVTGMNRSDEYSRSIPEEAARVVRLISRVHPGGAFRIMGYSSGGCVTLEAGRLLRSQGREVGFLGLLDTGLTDHYWPFGVWLSYMLPGLMETVKKRVQRVFQAAAKAGPAAPPADIVAPRRGTRYEFRFRDPTKPDYAFRSPHWRSDITPSDGLTRQRSLEMWGLYEPARYDGQVTFFFAISPNSISCSPQKYWPAYLSHVDWVPVPGNHITMMVGRYAVKLTAEVSARLRATLG